MNARTIIRTIIMSRTGALPALLILGAGAAALFKLLFRPGIELFLLAGIAIIVFLRFLYVRERRPGTKTSAALLIYAVLASVLTITMRDALGFLDVAPFKSVYSGEIPLELFRADAHQSVYEKHDIKLMVGQFALVFALYAAFLLEGARALGAFYRARLSPATALFAFVLFFAIVKLPPYTLDMPHWSPFLASASGISEGRWPYLHHYSVQYGLLNAGALALWLKAFALTPISLAFFVFSLTALSAILAFLLVRRLTNSKGAALLAGALLVTNFYDMDAALLAPNMGALRSHFQIISGLYLLWASLKPKVAISCLIAPFLFGFVCLWEPVYGLFMALSFWLISAYRYFLRHEKAALRQSLALLAGALLPVIAAAMIRPPELSFFSADTYNVLFSNHRLFMEGFGTAPQKFYSAEILVLAFYMAAAFVAYRQLSVGRGFTSMHLFIFATALMSPPWIAYELGNSNRAYLNPLAWLLAPATAVIIFTAYRYSVMTGSRVRLYAVSIIAAAPLFTMDIVKPLETGIGAYLTKYEEERAAWYRGCAENIREGRECDPVEQPGLRFYANAAAESSFGLGQTVGTEFSYYAPNLFLARACSRGVPIISNVDSVIHIRNGCPSPLKFPSTQHLTGKTLIAEYMKEIRKFPVIVFDERRFSQYYTEGLFTRIKGELLDSGYKAVERHGVISVLAMNGHSFDKDSCIICRPDRSTININSNSGKWRKEAGFTLRKKLLDAPDWQDFSLSALVRADGPAGFMLAARSATAYYAFYIDPQKNMATLGEYWGQDNREHRDIFNVPLKQARGAQWHELEVFASGEHYQFFVNGQFVAEWAGVGMGGSVGLWDWSGGARFQEIAVSKGPAAGSSI